MFDINCPYFDVAAAHAERGAGRVDLGSEKVSARCCLSRSPQEPEITRDTFVLTPDFETWVLVVVNFVFES